MTASPGRETRRLGPYVPPRRAIAVSASFSQSGSDPRETRYLPADGRGSYSWKHRAKAGATAERRTHKRAARRSAATRPCVQGDGTDERSCDARGLSSIGVSGCDRSHDVFIGSRKSAKIPKRRPSPGQKRLPPFAELRNLFQAQREVNYPALLRNARIRFSSCSSLAYTSST
jgi:hypothetical protein